MFGRKKKKKEREREQLFKREAYIPKSKLNKKERTVPSALGRKKNQENQSSRRGLGRLLVVTVLWICFLGEILYVVLFANFFIINNFDIHKENNGDHIQEDHIRGYMEESVSGKWYGVVPKNNLLLLPAAYHEKNLLARYPKIATVRISKQFPNTLKIEVTEKPFQVLWCRKEECFLVNKEGVATDANIFFQYPEEQGTVVRIQDMAEVPVQPGSRVMVPGDWQFVEALTTDFTLRTGLQLNGALERPSIYAEELRVRTDKNFSIFFNTRLPVTESLNTLMLILDREIPESEWEKIDYIDLRTENRIYYTRKDRAPEKTEEQKKREEEEERKQKEEEEKNTQS